MKKGVIIVLVVAVVLSLVALPPRPVHARGGWWIPGAFLGGALFGAAVARPWYGYPYYGYPYPYYPYYGYPYPSYPYPPPGYVYEPPPTSTYPPPAPEAGAKGEWVTVPGQMVGGKWVPEHKAWVPEK